MTHPPTKTRDAEKTKQKILTKAFELFAEFGYAKTGIRDIAQQAGVASSLIARHFGNKANLFEQTLIEGIKQNTLFVHAKPHFGQKMAQLVASQSNPKLPALIVLAIADPESKAIAQKVTQEHILTPLAEWLGPPNAQARALAMLTLLNGFVIQARHLSNQPPADAAVQWLSDALQTIVDQ